MKYVLIILFLMTGTSGCTTMHSTSGHVAVQTDSGYIDISFSDHDRNLIQNYYSRAKSKRAPPGLAKRGGHLPPGLAKRSTLPPGLQGRGLPNDLETSLVRLPEGYARLKIGADIVLMNMETQMVFDIIYGVD